MQVVLVTGDRASGKSELLDQLALRGARVVRLGHGPLIRAHDEIKARELGVIKAREQYDPDQHGRRLESAVLHNGDWSFGQKLHRRKLMFRDALSVAFSSFINMERVLAVEVPIVSLDFRVSDMHGWRDNLYLREYLLAFLTLSWKQHRQRLGFWILRHPMVSIVIAAVLSCLLGLCFWYLRWLLVHTTASDQTIPCIVLWLALSAGAFWTALWSMHTWVVVVVSDRRSQLERLQYRFAIAEAKAGQCVGARSLILMGGAESMLRRDLNIPWAGEGASLFREKSERFVTEGAGAGDKPGLMLIHKICRRSDFSLANHNNTPSSAIAKDAALLLRAIGHEQDPSLKLAISRFSSRVLLTICIMASILLILKLIWAFVPTWDSLASWWEEPL